MGRNKSVEEIKKTLARLADDLRHEIEMENYRAAEWIMKAIDKTLEALRAVS